MPQVVQFTVELKREKATIAALRRIRREAEKTARAVARAQKISRPK
jgi:hypothetical protein